MTTISPKIDALDELTQLRDELHVVWCALTSENHAEECIRPITEHVHGIMRRLAAATKKLEDAA